MLLLTDSEYTIALQRFMDKFACAELDYVNSEKWMIRGKVNAYTAKLMYLYYFAVTNYVHSDFVKNYITEKQVIEIFSKANSIC